MIDVILLIVLLLLFRLCVTWSIGILFIGYQLIPLFEIIVLFHLVLVEPAPDSHHSVYTLSHCLTAPDNPKRALDVQQKW